MVFQKYLRRKLFEHGTANVLMDSYLNTSEETVSKGENWI